MTQSQPHSIVKSDNKDVILNIEFGYPLVYLDFSLFSSHLLLVFIAFVVKDSDFLLVLAFACLSVTSYLELFISS